MRDRFKVVPPAAAPGSEEGARSAPSERPGAAAPPDPQFNPAASPARPLRRSAVEKLRILACVDACRVRGELGAFLRREGLYNVQIQRWRQQRDQGLLSPLATADSPPARLSAVAELERLRRENARLEKKLRKAEFVIELQKKACDLLGIPRRRPESGEDASRPSPRKPSP
jgi:transposase